MGVSGYVLKGSSSQQFVKALDKESPCFQYLVLKLPTVSAAKLQAGVLDGPQIRQLYKYSDFLNSMDETQATAWRSFVEVIHNSLGNNRDENYVALVRKMLEAFKNLGCRMSIKTHFLHDHLEKFPANFGAMSDD